MIKNHFTATGIVFNPQKEVLMIYHKKLKVWLPPGGHIDENELPCAAVVREIFEETGIKAEVIPNKKGIDPIELDMPFTILLEDIEGNGTHNHIDLVYLCRALTTNLNPQEAEVSGIGWFSHEQIMKLETFDNVLQTITKAMELYA